MKIRSGFVSNSSSSSFILYRSKLTEEQIEGLKNPRSKYPKDKIPDGIEDWCFTENRNVDTILMYTDMDNYSIRELFDLLEIPKETIIYMGFDSGIGPLELHSSKKLWLHYLREEMEPCKDIDEYLEHVQDFVYFPIDEMINIQKVLSSEWSKIKDILVKYFNDSTVYSEYLNGKDKIDVISSSPRQPIYISAYDSEAAGRSYMDIITIECTIEKNWNPVYIVKDKLLNRVVETNSDELLDTVSRMLCLYIDIDLFNKDSEGDLKLVKQQ